MQTRPATNEELLASLAFDMKYGCKTRFRHFVRECYAPNAKNGVKHVQYSRSKITIVDGAAFVTYRGTVEPITATVFVLDTGKNVVADVRIKSDYLP